MSIENPIAIAIDPPEQPPSPAFQLAVRLVAEALQPMDAEFAGSSRSKHLLRIRVAVQTVHQCLPIEYSRLHYRWQQGADVTHTEAMAAMRQRRTHWLAKAQALLAASAALDADDHGGEGSMVDAYLLAARDLPRAMGQHPGL